MNASVAKKARILKGVIVSDRMNKTVVVAVTRLKKHPKYGRRFRVTKRYKAHDETQTYHTGETVYIKESKPISREKRWTVVGRDETTTRIPIPA
ncbi:MAG: 30S ribosomal protein S17 [Parcubacteria group bacterium]|nr:30S ribosomal protein S17 [Parcubacteria group bacterium]